MFDVIINGHRQATFVLREEAEAKLAFEFGERCKFIARNTHGRGVYSFGKAHEKLELYRLEVAGEDVSLVWEGMVKEG